MIEALGTEARIREILRRVARLDGEYSSTADLFRDLGVKSIAALDLLLSLEDEFSVTIADEAFATARSVQRLALLVDEVRVPRSSEPSESLAANRA